MKRAWHSARARRAAVVLVVLSGAALGAASEARAFVLVTPQEFAREQAGAKERPFRGDAKGDLGSPAIVLVRPASLRGLHSPTDIELRFVPKGPATVVLSTLRVLYGFFGIDVTDRLLKHAKVSPSGIVARDASLPEGSHRITVEVSDSKRRVGRKTFRFEITGSDMK